MRLEGRAHVVLQWRRGGGTLHRCEQWVSPGVLKDTGRGAGRGRGGGASEHSPCPLSVPRLGPRETFPGSGPAVFRFEDERARMLSSLSTWLPLCS